MILTARRNTFHPLLYMPLLVYPQTTVDPLAFLYPCGHHVCVIDR